MNTEYTQISNKDYIIKDDKGSIRTVNIFHDDSLIEEILIKENEAESIEMLIQKEYENIVNIKNSNTINKIVDVIVSLIGMTIIISFILTSYQPLKIAIPVTLASTYIVDKSITVAFLGTKRKRKKNIILSESKIKILEEKLKNIKTEIRNLKHKADFKENNRIRIPSRKINFQKLDLSIGKNISTYEEELDRQLITKRKIRKK